MVFKSDIKEILTNEILHVNVRVAKTTINFYAYLICDEKNQEAAKVVYLIHGVKGNAKRLINSAVQSAKEIGLTNYLFVAPELAGSNNATLTLGNMYDSARIEEKYPKSEWTFNYITKLHKYLKLVANIRNEYSLFGHSAGAQFVHRFVLFGDNKNLESTVVANSGWYTTHSKNQAFPYGIKGVEHHLNQNALQKNVMVLLGRNDITQDSNFRMTKRAIMQGNSRLGRGEYFYKVAQQYASDHDEDFAWRLSYVDNVGHDSRSMIQAALAMHLI